MREPLEDYTILVSRVNTKVKYETKFLFASAMNPCPCGNLLAKTKNCRCSDIEIQRYKNRLSDPFLDRIDIYVTMSEISKEDKADVSSSELHNKVLKAFKQQMNRGQNELNGKLNDKDIKKYCVLQNDANEILDKAISNYTLSFRAINKVLKLSRTIADLEEVDLIQTSHILEALSYRKR
jgi:magnesium chelatase family protein